MTRKWKVLPLVAATATALVLTACAQSDRDTSGGGSGTDGAASGMKDTFTFGGAGAPVTFDPFYASDGETFRVSRQIFENLIGIKQGTADLEPELAESWEASDDGLEWTFKLREGVKFHDGTDFNGEAACTNFDRMFDQNEVGQVAAYYWGGNFGFADGGNPSLYGGCEVKGDHEILFKVTRVTSKFPAILSLTSFGMQSPKALEDGKANEISRAGEAFNYPANASNPVGTGPYKFGSWDAGTQTVTLDRNDDYWSDAAKTAKIVIRAIPDESTRRQELQAGGIDGYDLPNPVDWKGLEDAGNKVEVRPPFNIFYLGLNPTNNEHLKDFRVRQALYYALNREQIVASQLPDGANVATQFVPSTVEGYNSSVEAYPYDPDKAKALLAEAGAEGMTFVFAYPTEVTRPYMPDPAKLYDAMKADFEAVGIKVETRADPWGAYLDNAYNQYDGFFLGWTGDYNSVDNFLANFFGTNDPNRFATDKQDFGAELGSELIRADGIADEAERTKTYEEINKRIMEEWLPGLAISSSPPAIVVSGKVSGLITSPLTAERFDTVEVQN